MKRIRAILVIAVAVAAVSAGAIPAFAAFPEKPITMVVAYRAGGSADNVARLLSEYMERSLGQPVVVTNKAGGGGAVAATYMMNRKPDGYEIMMQFSLTFTFLPQFTGKMKFKHDDFSHISRVIFAQGALVTQTDKPWKDLGEMLEYFKKRNQAISLTSQVPVVRLMADTITKQTGVKFKIVPIKGGTEGGQKLLGGHVDLVWAGSWHLKYVNAGSMKIVGATGDKLTYAPNVPTLKELGFPIIYMGGSFMFSGPKGIPKDRLDVLYGAIKGAAEQKKIMNMFQNKFHFRVPVSSPEETETFIRDEKAAYDRFLAATGTKKTN